jgi:nitrile hydratase beta subunit
MNGIHDMGGMDGFGPVMREEHEPVFHSRWEARLFGLLAACRRTGNADEFRHAIERIPAPRHLNSSYYERWLDALQILLIEKGMLSRDELLARGADPPIPAQAPMRLKPMPPRRARARFRPGDPIVARNLNPAGHTRLPRYVRGKRGVVRRDWGIYAFPDTNAHGGGERPQHVYSVAFKARELWGASAASRDWVYIDLWEDYLQAAAPRSSASARRRRIAAVNRRASKR